MNKINFSLQRLVLAASLLWSASLPVSAQFASPVGTWDVVISGKAKGVATLTFTADNLVCGAEIITAASSGSEDPTGLRYTGSEPGRYPTQTSSNNLSSANVLYGFYKVEGWWSFDSAGKVVGSFPEIGTRTEATTTSVVFTNDFGIVETNLVSVTEPIYVTNSVNFVLKVVPGKRLTMTGASGIGTVKYRGVPSTELLDVNYPLLGETKRGGQLFYETLYLRRGDLPGFCVPIYEVCGQGPTYGFYGVALISNQKKMALNSSWVDTSETIARSVMGSFNPLTLKGTLKGSEDPNFKVNLKLSPLLYGVPASLCDAED